MGQEWTVVGDVAFVELKHNKVAAVNTVDLPTVQQYHWFSVNTGATEYDKQHWLARAKKNGKRVDMHRVIAEEMGLDVADKTKCVDHIDGNPTSNVRSNLRLVDYRTNGLNRRSKINRNNTSGYRGIIYMANQGKNPWRVNLRVPEVGYSVCWANVASLASAATLSDLALVRMHGPQRISPETLNYPQNWDFYLTHLATGLDADIAALAGERGRLNHQMWERKIWE